MVIPIQILFCNKGTTGLMFFIGLQMSLTVEMHLSLKYLPYVYAYYFIFFLKKVKILAVTLTKDFC